MSGPLRNARHESFAVLVGSMGMSLTQAYKESGFNAKRADECAHKLSRKVDVAERILTLNQRRQAKLEAKASVSRERIMLQLDSLAFAGKSEMVQLKAIELLTKLLGYNEPEKRDVQHVHMHVDAGLIAKLRAGYGELSARERLEAGCIKHVDACKPLQPLQGGGRT